MQNLFLLSGLVWFISDTNNKINISNRSVIIFFKAVPSIKEVIVATVVFRYLKICNIIDVLSFFKAFNIIK